MGRNCINIHQLAVFCPAREPVGGPTAGRPLERIGRLHADNGAPIEFGAMDQAGWPGDRGAGPNRRALVELVVEMALAPTRPVRAGSSVRALHGEHRGPRRGTESGRGNLEARPATVGGQTDLRRLWPVTSAS